MTAYILIPALAVAAASLALVLAIRPNTTDGSAFNPIAEVAAVLTGEDTVTPWEHGLKTDRITATRYSNKDFGYNIGFQFPKNGNEADRAEVGDFFELHDGWLYQGGGYSGAEAFVKFKDVTDRESADAKLKAILPALSTLIRDLGNGVKVNIAKKKPEYEWPNTSPIDKTDPYWEFNNNTNVNGAPYKKAEVSPGKWQWIVDQETMERYQKYEARKQELYMALQRRVLTDDEMKEAINYGTSINIQPMVAYFEADKQRERNEAFAQQARLRAAAGAHP